MGTCSGADAVWPSLVLRVELSSSSCALGLGALMQGPTGQKEGLQGFFSLSPAPSDPSASLHFQLNWKLLAPLVHWSPTHAGSFWEFWFLGSFGLLVRWLGWGRGADFYIDCLQNLPVWTGVNLPHHLSAFFILFVKHFPIWMCGGSSIPRLCGQDSTLSPWQGSSFQPWVLPRHASLHEPGARARNLLIPGRFFFLPAPWKLAW